MGLAQYSSLWEENEVSPDGKTEGKRLFLWNRRRGQRQGAESGQGHVLQLLIQGLEVIEKAGWSKDVRRTWAGGKVTKEAEVPPGACCS